MMVGARGGLGLVALTCALALTGCTPDSPAGPTPSPSPASQTPTETAQERQERLDYAAAEKSYRTFRAEYERVLRAGGAKQSTPVMKATAGGNYLATLTDVVQGFKKLGSRHVGKEEILFIRQEGYAPSSLVLEACEDSRAVTTVRKSGSNGSGELLVVRVEVKKVGNVWKVWDGTGELVKSCD